MTHVEVMRSFHIPPTRESLAAQSGEWCALFDCLECSRGVYMPGPPAACSVCGATPPDAIASVMFQLAEKAKAA